MNDDGLDHDSTRIKAMKPQRPFQERIVNATSQEQIRNILAKAEAAPYMSAKTLRRIQRAAHARRSLLGQREKQKRAA